MKILIACWTVRQSMVGWLPIGLAILSLLGCAKTTVESVQQYRGEPLPKPGLVLVHDFTFRSDQVKMKPTNASMSGAALTAQQRGVGQAVSRVLAHRLVDEILVMGLPAKRGDGDSTAAANVYSVEGSFVSIDLGDLRRREIIGLGHTEVETRVKLYRNAKDGKLLLETLHVTAEGEGSGPFGTQVEADASRTAKKLGVELRAFFAEQGWVSP
jgi:hypothetical protein